MGNEKKRVDPIPEEFASLEEAVEFWETHDTMDYPEAFDEEPVEIQANFKRRRFEVEVEEDLMGMLRAKARDSGTSVRRWLGELLRRELLASS